MSDYHQIEQGHAEPPARAPGSTWRAGGVLGLGLAAVALVCVVVVRGPAASALPSSADAKLLATGHGLKRSSAGHLCNCPPSEVMWTCGEDEYRALINGSTCEYYRTSPGECRACERDQTSLECRACKLGLSQRGFCGQCVEQGLNDVGCRGCTELSAAPPVGADADEHGCRPSAGFRWCASSASCVRPFELGLHTPKAFEAKCGQSQPAASGQVRVGGDTDPHGCRPSAGYRWCEAEAACVRPWEMGLSEEAVDAKCKRTLQVAEDAILGGDRDAHGCIPSAGYSWCGAMRKCIRPREHGIRSKSEFQARCSLQGGKDAVYP